MLQKKQHCKGYCTVLIKRSHSNRSRGKWRRHVKSYFEIPEWPQHTVLPRSAKVVLVIAITAVTTLWTRVSGKSTRTDILVPARAGGEITEKLLRPFLAFDILTFQPIFCLKFLPKILPKIQPLKKSPKVPDQAAELESLRQTNRDQARHHS